MNLYETTFIINPQTDDATIDQRVRDVAELIAKSDGRIVHEDHMGTRRLAYEINGLTQGYYASFIFEGPKTVLPTLRRHFKLNEAYIRHLTVRFEGGTDDLARLQAATAPDVEKSAEESERPRPATRRPEEPRQEVVSADANDEEAEEAEESDKEDKGDAPDEDAESGSETTEESEL